MTDLDIGEPASFTDTDDGSTNGEGSLILLGTLAFDYVNDSYSREYDLSNGPVALTRARPGIEAIQGGAQVYKIIEFTGSGTRPVKFDITVDFNVQAIAAGGDANLTTKTFAYDFYNKEHLEKDKISEASDPGTPLLLLWSNSRTTSEDIFAEVSAGDAVAVGTRVLVGAASGGLSTAYGDAKGGPAHEGTEFVKQVSVDVSWP